MMKQLEVPEEMKADVDISGPDIPASVKQLRPVVFREGNAYCCLLGPDPQAGVFGCGSSAKEALQDWDRNLQALKKSGNETDEVLQYIRQQEANTE
jgi:hypothetical protein